MGPGFAAEIEPKGDVTDRLLSNESRRNKVLKMKVLRTPDERFSNLPGFPFEPRYRNIIDGDGTTLRMHYVDEGPRDGRIVLLLHGEPTWSYLYRKMIPSLTAAGMRVLAPDLIGMGRSDKPADQSDYRFDRHVEWLEQWVKALDVKSAIWFGQDWGSFIGLGMLSRNPERFDAIVLANGIIPDVENMARMMPFAMKAPDPTAFTRWQQWIKGRTDIDCASVIGDGIPGTGLTAHINLSAGERAAYNAPFPDPSYQASALVFPFLGNTMNEAGRKICTNAWKVLDGWTKPLITAYGKADPVLGWADDLFQHHVPGAKGMPHRTFQKGTHFIQEEEPEALSLAILDAVKACRD